MYDLSDKDENKNVTLKCETMFYESEDNIIVLPKEKLAVIQDLKGYIVAESDNVLLICKRSDEGLIRQFVNDANFKYNGKYS
jgi:mannose-1-phosphate guanylyltransferase